VTENGEEKKNLLLTNISELNIVHNLLVSELIIIFPIFLMSVTKKKRNLFFTCQFSSACLFVVPNSYNN